MTNNIPIDSWKKYFNEYYYSNETAAKACVGDWRLPTKDEVRELLDNYCSNPYKDGRYSGCRDDLANLGFPFVLAGILDSSGNPVTSTKGFDEFWLQPEPGDRYTSYYYVQFTNGDNETSHDAWYSYVEYAASYYLSVRCVKDYIPQ